MFRLAPAEEPRTRHRRLIFAPVSGGVARYLDFGNSSIFGFDFFWVEDLGVAQRLGTLNHGML